MLRDRGPGSAPWLIWLSRAVASSPDMLSEFSARSRGFGYGFLPSAQWGRTPGKFNSFRVCAEMSTPRDPRRRRSRHRRGPESRKRNGGFQGQEVAAARVLTNAEIAERICERLPLPPKATPIPISVATDDKVIKTSRERLKKFGGIRSALNMALRPIGRVGSVEG